LAETIDAVLARPVYVLAPFARPEAEAAAARQGWLGVWRQFARRGHEAELAAAEREFAETMTDESWARVEALRKLVGESEGGGADIDGWDDG